MKIKQSIGILSIKLIKLCKFNWNCGLFYWFCFHLCIHRILYFSFMCSKFVFIVICMNIFLLCQWFLEANTLTNIAPCCLFLREFLLNIAIAFISPYIRLCAIESDIRLYSLFRLNVENFRVRISRAVVVVVTKRMTKTKRRNMSHRFQRALARRSARPRDQMRPWNYRKWHRTQDVGSNCSSWSV